MKDSRSRDFKKSWLNAEFCMKRAWSNSNEIPDHVYNFDLYGQDRTKPEKWKGDT